MDDLLSDVGFSHCLGLGPMSYAALLKQFGSSHKAYHAPSHELKELLGTALATSFITFRQSFKAQTAVKAYERNNIHILNRDHSLYPSMLQTISDPPICLYVKGDIARFVFNHERSLAVVGTRRPTTYGVSVTKMLVDALCTEGWTIVSGLALGIDAVAHATAVGCGGRTVAFLGCGVNIVYPAANARLYERLIHGGNLIISEFPPDMTVRKGMFISRNRLISGLSRGVLVIEGTSTSGALATARYAAVQGRDVLAIPAPITSEQSQAPNLLLKEGAVMVTQANDIFEFYNMSQSHNHVPAEPLFDSAIEQRIYSLLKAEALRSDALAEKLTVSISAILQTLSSLEMKGAVRQTLAGEYELSHDYV